MSLAAELLESFAEAEARGCVAVLSFGAMHPPTGAFWTNQASEHVRYTGTRAGRFLPPARRKLEFVPLIVRISPEFVTWVTAGAPDP